MKRFEMTIIDTGNQLHFDGINEGFSALELIGLFTWKIDDIKKQMFGEIKPDIVTRTCIKPPKKVEVDNG
jgi:hypothetical protein